MLLHNSLQEREMREAYEKNKEGPHLLEGIATDMAFRFTRAQISRHLKKLGLPVGRRGKKGGGGPAWVSTFCHLFWVSSRSEAAGLQTPCQQRGKWDRSFVYAALETMQSAACKCHKACWTPMLFVMPLLDFQWPHWMEQ